MFAPSALFIYTADFILPGFFVSNRNAVPSPCPPDTFAEELRSVGSARSCSRCPTGTTTDGKSGQTECDAVKPGYFYVAGINQTWPCPRDSVAPGVRALTDPLAQRCFACPTGLSTNTSRAQSTCGEWLCLLFVLL
jgi:hypothetical protein